MRVLLPPEGDEVVKSETKYRHWGYGTLSLADFLLSSSGMKNLMGMKGRLTVKYPFSMVVTKETRLKITCKRVGLGEDDLVEVYT